MANSAQACKALTPTLHSTIAALPKCCIALHCFSIVGSVQGAGDMLDDGKYQCNIKDELAQKLARNLQINLNAYLLYV